MELLPPAIAWIDYETNGVPEDGMIVPLEVGMILTDKYLNEIDTFQSLILTPGWQSYMNRAKPIVQKMHTQSGLLKELAKAEDGYGGDLHPRKVEGRILTWLEGHCGVEPEKLPMTGSTVHFDRHVAQQWMPDLNRWFHYRNQDVSSLKNFCRLFNPTMYRKLPAIENKTHRPLDDLRCSIEELRWYRDNFLFIEGDDW